MRSVSKAADLQGVFTALFTPLLDDDPSRLRNTIDREKAKTMIDDLIEVGVDGLIPVGTTGQSPTVSHRQHIEFIEFVVNYVDDRVPVIAGAGSNCTRESVEMIEAIQSACGELAFLCVTGYYNNPPQSGLVRHYETVSRETGAKLVLYNVPGRTASYLEPETVIRLARDPNVIGLKQAVDFGSPGRFREDTARVIRAVAGEEFAVLSGEDDGLIDILELGGAGIVSASANIPEVARAFLRLIGLWEAGDTSEAEAIEASVLPIVEGVFMRKNPIPLAALFDSPVYLPLVDLRETEDGASAHERLMALADASLPSLRKYHERGVNP